MLKVRLNLPLWYFALIIGLTGLAITGVQRRWRWPIRFLVHTSWIFLMLSSSLLELSR
jgi:hypothetical protein